MSAQTTFFTEITPSLIVPMNMSCCFASHSSLIMQGGGVETLRAIPWIFAWTQVRMVLPAWLGIDTALRRLFDEVSLTQAVLSV